MRYRKLGDFGVKVSEIALGSWLTYGGSVEDEKATACIHRAFELGVNFFDTANVYRRGAAEEVTGRALKGIDRDDYFLATKVYFPMGDGPNDRGLSRKHIMEQCHASLRRLGTDYIDLYPVPPRGRRHAARGDVARAGRPRHAGQGALRRRLGVVGAAHRRGAADPGRAQPRPSGLEPARVLDAAAEDRGRTSSRSAGGSASARSSGRPLAQGVLAGKYKPGEEPAERTRAATPGDQDMMSRFMRDDVLDGGAGPAADRGRPRHHDAAARARLGST
jgi:aryl-alcohol dehydrogenase-like predicted oxidoreductase